MGTAIAATLIRSGCTLTIWNRSPVKCQALCENGATAARSVTAAVENSDIIFVCLSNHAVMKALFFDDRVGEALRGKLLVS